MSRGWGGVAKRGSRVITDAEGSASHTWRDAVVRARGDRTGEESWSPEIWVEDDEVEVGADEAAATPSRTSARGRGRSGPAGATGAMAAPRPGGRSRGRRRVPEEIADEIEKEAGARRSGRLVDRLAEATRAYERERYRDARSILRPLAEEAPGSAAVRELLGLTEYRLGHWRDAARQLEAFRSLSGSVEQHPVLADSYRALRRHRRVEELWEELRAASPSSELVTEGRIVMAGSLADRGDIPGAIRLLEKGRLDRRHPQEHHLRQWYALANLYERSGDIPRARDLFQRVAAHDPDTFDVTERARALR